VLELKRKAEQRVNEEELVLNRTHLFLPIRGDKEELKTAGESGKKGILWVERRAMLPRETL